MESHLEKREGFKNPSHGIRPPHSGRGILIQNFLNFACCQVVAFCSLISELFLIMYALGSFFPMLVIFFNLYGDFNGKMAKFQFLAINCSRSVLHLSSYHY